MQLGGYWGDVEEKFGEEVDDDRMILYDEDHKVDRIEEFEICNDRIEFYFYDGELNEITYDFEIEDMTYDEMVDTVAEYYGEDFYRKDGYTTYWCQDGTVLCLEYGSVTYLWDDYYCWTHRSNDDVREYFEK